MQNTSYLFKGKTTQWSYIEPVAKLGDEIFFKEDSHFSWGHIFLCFLKIATMSYVLQILIAASPGLQLELVLMDYVSGWVNLTKESLKLLFKSIYLIYNRHIDPIKLKFLLHAKSINTDSIFTTKSLCISQQLSHNQLPQCSSHWKMSIDA